MLFGLNSHCNLTAQQYVRSVLAFQCSGRSWWQHCLLLEMLLLLLLLLTLLIPVLLSAVLVLDSRLARGTPLQACLEVYYTLSCNIALMRSVYTFS